MNAIEPFKRLLSQIDTRAPDHMPLHQVLPNNGPTVGDFRELMAHISEAGFLSLRRKVEEQRRALAECVAYISSPVRMTRDEDEAARRAGIIDRARALAGDKP